MNAEAIRISKSLVESFNELVKNLPPEFWNKHRRERRYLRRMARQRGEDPYKYK